MRAGCRWREGLLGLSVAWRWLEVVYLGSGHNTMQFAICNELFTDWTWEKTCQFSAECGYEGIEVAPYTLASRINEVSNDQRRKLSQRAKAAGIEVVGLHWLLAKTEGLHLTSPELDVRNRTSEYLKELIRACRDIGGDIMVFGSPQQRDCLPGVTHQEATEFAVQTITEILPVLETNNVTLCMEPLAPSETNFLQTCAETIALVDRIGHENVTLHLDVKAMSSEQVSIVDLIKKYGPRAGHFHANDANLLGPGFGEIDFGPIFQSLNEVSYQGWVSVEVFDYSPGPERLAKDSISYMKQFVNAS